MQHIFMTSCRVTYLITECLELFTKDLVGGAVWEGTSQIFPQNLLFSLQNNYQGNKIIKGKVLKLLIRSQMSHVYKIIIWNVLLTWTQIPKMKHLHSIAAEKIKAKVGLHWKQIDVKRWRFNMPRIMLKAHCQPWCIARREHRSPKFHVTQQNYW